MRTRTERILSVESFRFVFIDDKGREEVERVDYGRYLEITEEGFKEKSEVTTFYGYVNLLEEDRRSSLEFEGKVGEFRVIAEIPIFRNGGKVGVEDEILRVDRILPPTRLAEERDYFSVDVESTLLVSYRTLPDTTRLLSRSLLSTILEVERVSNVSVKPYLESFTNLIAEYRVSLDISEEEKNVEAIGEFYSSLDELRKPLEKEKGGVLPFDSKLILDRFVISAIPYSLSSEERSFSYLLESFSETYAYKGVGEILTYPDINGDNYSLRDSLDVVLSILLDFYSEFLLYLSIPEEKKKSR